MTEHSQTPEASATTSEADEDSPSGVSDAQLPDDLTPGEDNPLAQPLDPDDESTKDPDELGMDDTQDDTGGTYESSGDTPSTQLDEELEAEDGAQGAGISG